MFSAIAVLNGLLIGVPCQFAAFKSKFLNGGNLMVSTLIQVRVKIWNQGQDIFV